jgi:hypothetical protein
VALSQRGSTECRACGSFDLFVALDLGWSPIANSLPPLNLAINEPKYPLALRICGECQLGQIPEFKSPGEIFSSYPYLSSTSSFWVEHAHNFCSTVLERFPHIRSSYVLEIASNDGYLLQHFRREGINVLGVDPARNVANTANTKGIPTISEFFGVTLSKEICKDYGYPSLIVANNVAAHVPDMIDFFGGISELCGPETVVSIENPSLGFLLEKGYYDTIYHEHFSYLTVLPIQKLVNSLGMKIFHVETLDTHGGSLRYWITKSTSIGINQSVEQTKKEEFKRGVGDLAPTKTFASQARASMQELFSWVVSQPLGSIIGYGAAAKTVTTFFAANLPENRFRMIVDANELKQNKRLPGTLLPIVGVQKLRNPGASKVLVFPWNLESEIVQTIRSVNPDIEVWIPNPIRRLM